MIIEALEGVRRLVTRLGLTLFVLRTRDMTVTSSWRLAGYYDNVIMGLLKTGRYDEEEKENRASRWYYV